MPLTQINFIPGINTENTPTGNEGRWIDGDNIRFRKGLPQKIGGWNKFSDEYFVGAVRGLFSYYDLDGSRYAIIPSNKKIYVYSSNDVADITPTRSTANLTNVFNTTTGNTTIVVNDVGHGAFSGDFVTFSNLSVANVGGISNTVINNEFEIKTITNSDAYTIESPNAATSNVTTTGNVDAVYQIATGPDIQTFGYGWGAGTWSTSTWNTPRTTSDVTLDLASYTVNNWGEDVLVTRKNGKTYYYDTSAGISNSNKLTLVANAPTSTVTSVVATDSRHFVCLGTETEIGNSSSQDKLFVRFSDQENYDSFVANVTNSAGSQRIVGGSEIRSAKNSKGGILIWTDSTLHIMSFIGPPFIFGFRQLGNDCGAVGLYSSIVIDDISYWMSDGQFFRYTGAVQEIPCTVLNYVFNDINKTQYQQVYAAQNSEFSEVIWFYCSSNSNYIDRMVAYNYQENTWHYGSLDRTSYLDNQVYQNPIASKYFTNTNTYTLSTINGLSNGVSLIYNQEIGTEADGLALTSFIESGDADISDGENFTFINKIIPDFKNQVGNVKVTLKSRDYPSDSQTSGEVKTIEPSTRFINTRIRGRQVSLKIENDSTNQNWRLGTMRINAKQDGKR